MSAALDRCDKSVSNTLGMGFKSRAKWAARSSPDEYIAAVPRERRGDIQRLHELIREVAPELEPTMAFGMLGYGPTRYRYASGREGEWVKISLANQKRYISLYCCAADDHGYVAERFRKRLPKASIGKSCVRFRQLDDLDQSTLRQLIRETAAASWGL